MTRYCDWMKASALSAALAALLPWLPAQAADNDIDPLADPPSPAFEGQADAPEVDSGADFAKEVLMSDLVQPRSLEALPDGNLLVVQGDGQAWVLSPEGEARELGGMPAVRSVAQRGLFDVTLDANFDNNRRVYLTYMAPPPGEEGGPVDPAEAEERRAGDEVFEVPQVARARLSADNRRLEDLEVIAEIKGRRLKSAPDGRLFITTQGHGPFRPEVQDLSTRIGKVLRINGNGSIPRNNPFVHVPNARGEIFSVGHRDPDGLAIHPVTGELWAIEHGPMGGDELNLIRPGVNYGWPAITYGKDYSGDVISGSAAPGLAQPRYYWYPSVAPSGLMFYTGDDFPEWRGDLFLGTMSPTQGKFLVRLELDGERVTARERLLVDHDRRVRSLAQGPDGEFYVLTDSEDNDELDRHFPGEVLRLTPR